MTGSLSVPAIILAGGLGTRLRGITRDRWPKPMTPVPGPAGPRPFLEWPLAWLRREGITEVVICLGHLGNQIREHFGNGRTLGLDIVYDDSGAVETGARCRAAFQHLTEDLALVVCGDVFVDFATAPFLAQMSRGRELMAKLALARRGSGAVANTAIDGEGRVTGFCERGVNDIRAAVEAGVLALRRVALEGYDAGSALSLTEHVYPRLIAKRALGAEVVADTFHDIGTPDGLARFCDFARSGWSGTPSGAEMKSPTMGGTGNP